ncbi:MAG: UDP-N-acetylmuramoyl-L-alanyl-D-glutamate--2,6-diaminopimelate ligase [Solirubrobacteraceae bacterium]
MELNALFPGAPPGVTVTGLAYDNRSVRAGDLFFCVPGFTRDGHDFAAAAVAAGAVALVADHPLKIDVPQVVVADVRRSMGPAAAAFFGDPTALLQLAGVTGTNGKTTTAYLIRAMLEAAGRQTGMLGTVKSVIARVESDVQRTTPEGIDLQRSLRAMVDGGDRACVMEVSSHALALGRVEGCHFDVGIFTNLTQDHLDFHPTMEDYFLAKRRLFLDGASSVTLANVDDPYGARLAADPAISNVIRFGLGRHAADYSASNLRASRHGTDFTLATPEGTVDVHSPLRGRFNVYNALGAIGAARALGVTLAEAVKALADAGQVPGRFQTVDEGQPFAVVVDYAHTPDSLENVLRAARNLDAGRVIVVFGCGGDRDRGKRPLMGEIASRLADEVIITSDNPRSEDPQAIIAEILAGASRKVDHQVDRQKAITAAIGRARKGDVVVIAGKGHERGQEFEAGRKVPFDDVVVARQALRMQR